MVTTLKHSAGKARYRALSSPAASCAATAVCHSARICSAISTRISGSASSARPARTTSASIACAGAQRLRFILDFAYATGLRASELIGATPGDIRTDEYHAHWLHLVGKGSRPGKVALPPLARTALDQHLVQRGLPVTPARWDPKTPLIASLEQDSVTSITGTRLWSVMRRFFGQAADVIAGDNPAAAEKRAAPVRWMRHTHRHASVATTSIYLQSDEVQRARQMDQAFAR